MKLIICKSFVLFFIAAVLALMGGLTAFNSRVIAAQEIKRVFVLNSFNRGYVWTDNMLRGIDDAFGILIKVE